MNRIQSLIQKHCPSGVEFRALGEVCNSLPKGTLKTTQLQNNGYPVINSGRELYGYYSKFNNESNAFTIAARGEYAGFINFMNTQFWAGGLCYPYRSKNENKLLTKFIFYHLKSQQQKIMDTLVARGSIPAINKSDCDKLQIPIPPLEIQKEIVKILDAFTELEKELEKELEARRKQYEYYREKLLSFESLINRAGGGQFVKMMRLGEVLAYEQPSKYIVKSTEYDNSYKIPVLTAGQSFILGYTNETNGIYQANKQNPCIIFDDFTTSFQWVDFPFKVKSSAMKILTLCHTERSEVSKKKSVDLQNYLDSSVASLAHNDNIMIRFIYYAMKCIKYSTMEHSRQWIEKYSKIQIPIPPLKVQNEVVEILDKFDALVNDITSGIPAEINARKKQYEHYRERLLTFKESK